MYKRCSDMSQMFRICSPGAYEFSGTNRRSERVRGNIYSPQRQTDSHGQNDNLALDPSRVDLALHIQPRRHVGYCSPRCLTAQGNGLTPEARCCPRRVPPPHSVQCGRGGAPWRRLRKGSSSNESVKAQSDLLWPDPGADRVVFRQLRCHPRAPGGASEASNLPVTVPEPPT